jgi:hypothetical protein
MIIVGCTIAGAAAGLILGVIVGERQGGDYNFAPAMYGPAYAAVGAVIGCIIGVAVFD